jgi:hypothetical protein
MQQLPSSLNNTAIRRFMNSCKSVMVNILELRNGVAHKTYLDGLR